MRPVDVGDVADAPTDGGGIELAASDSEAASIADGESAEALSRRFLEHRLAKVDSQDASLGAYRFAQRAHEIACAAAHVDRLLAGHQAQDPHDDGQADAGIAGGAFDDDAAGVQLGDGAARYFMIGEDAEDGGNGAWIVQNSWGTGWGDAGRIKFAVNFNSATQPLGTCKMMYIPQTVVPGTSKA